GEDDEEENHCELRLPRLEVLEPELGGTRVGLRRQRRLPREAALLVVGGDSDEQVGREGEQEAGEERQGEGVPAYPGEPPFDVALTLLVFGTLVCVLVGVA